MQGEPMSAEDRVDGWHAVGAPVKYHNPLDPPLEQHPDTQDVAARAQRDADRARAQRYYMSGIYETAEGESVRREFRPVGPWSAGRYEANAGIEPGRYSHPDRRPETDKRDEEANDAERFTVERTAALAEVALLRALLRDMRWHPVDGGLMVVPPGWQQRRDIALGLRKGEADRG